MNSKFRGSARVAFFACQASVRSMFDAGHNVNVIYETHENVSKVMSYSQFARYVAKYVGSRNKPRSSPAKPTPHAASRKKTLAPNATPPRKKPTAIDLTKHSLDDLV